MFEAIDRESSKLTVSLSNTLRTFAFKGYDDVSVVSYYGSVDLSLLSGLVLTNVIGSRLFCGSLCDCADFIGITFLQFISRFLSSLTRTGLG